MRTTLRLSLLFGLAFHWCPRPFSFIFYAFSLEKIDLEQVNDCDYFFHCSKNNLMPGLQLATLPYLDKTYLIHGLFYCFIWKASFRPTASLLPPLHWYLIINIFKLIKPVRVFPKFAEVPWVILDYSSWMNAVPGRTGLCRKFARTLAHHLHPF